MCEKSQAVTMAFRQMGHEFYSCDIEPCTGGYPEWHIISESDMHSKDILYGQHWDFMGGHPECTRLTNAVIWYIKKNSLWDEVRQAAIFFEMVRNAPIKKKYVENPVQHGYVRNPNKYNDILIPPPTQYIQPYQFYCDASKKTGLWLTGLPKLKPTNEYPPRIVNYRGKMVKRWSNQTDGGWNRLGPSDTRSEERSRTEPNIARAMAWQWG